MWVAIFGLVVLAAYLAMSVIEPPPKETPQQRLQRLVAQRGRMEGFMTRDLPGAPVNPNLLEAMAEPKRPNVKELVVAAVERATSGLKVSTRLAARLGRANWRWLPAEFLMAQGMSLVVGLLIAMILAPSLWWLFAVMGYATPVFLLGRAEKARMKSFDQQLPDALAIIANALRSGYSFLQAMDVVSREMPDPVAREFGLVLREARVNIPLEEALQHLVDRIKSPDLDLVVTAVIIQRQVGGNLSEVLEKISVTIKERVRMQGEIRTLTTQGRFSGWIVSLLPFALAVMMQVVSPGFLTPLFTQPIGWLLLFVGIVMQGIGIFAIRKMVNLEV